MWSTYFTRTRFSCIRSVLPPILPRQEMASTTKKLNLADPEIKKQALKSVAMTIPIVPYKGVDFFDIGGLLANPVNFQLTFDLFVHIVTPFIHQVDTIGCFDARGFLFGPYLGTFFQKRVFMLRKPDKMPNISDIIDYWKEYQGDNTTGGDSLSIQTYAVKKKDRVLLVDDLLATGGTCEAGIRLVQQAGASVIASIFVIEISELNGRERAIKASTDKKIRIMSLLTEKDF